MTAPNAASVLTAESMKFDLSDPCPNCGHALAEHPVELGCDHGWSDVSSGCPCPLTVALQHGPVSEHGGRRYR